MSEVLDRPKSAFRLERPYDGDILVTAVPYDFLAEEFMRTGPLMEKVVKTTSGRFQVEDLFDACVERRMTLWIVVWMPVGQSREYLAVIFTSVRDYPRKRALRVDFVAGTRMSEWLGKFALAYEEAARIEKCDLMEGGGRMGWSRVFKKIGLQPTGCFFEAEVSDAQ
jgi:hypothetical protein